MPTWKFVRDSLILAAGVVLFAGAATLIVNLILTYVPDGQDRAVPNPVAIALLYLLALGLLFVLWRSHESPSRA